ncbi:MAG TPA: GlxA family transcriptional regulator [Steroidobacteraceae bacterium]|jgi:transcriptional regulator GlxA family with amidase domain|nr:GlxA family transcriptional regulator [Steroidobacteraceae bacterium]
MELGALGQFGFLTLPNYSMIACANAIEALRMANRVSARSAYRWQLLTPDGAAARASNGMSLQPTAPIAGARSLDIVFVCGGVDIRRSTGRAVLSALRRLARDQVPLGALCTGSFALAEAGLLSGYRCAIHWENLAAIREEFPEIQFLDDLYTIDRDRITCTGGIAPLDLMLTLIRARLGNTIADRIATQFIVERGRRASERQPLSPAISRAAAHERLEVAVRLIQSKLDERLRIGAIAREAGLSTRQLERLFKRHFGQTPAALWKRWRLERARTLLTQTAMPITDVSIACGFSTAAHFSTAYRNQFGRTPSNERAVS